MALRDRALAVLTAVLWGGNFVAIHFGLQQFPPIFFACLRYLLIAVPTILLVPRPIGLLRPLIGYGVSFGGFQFVLLFLAMNAGMPPGLSSLVLQAAAPMTVLLGIFVLRERCTTRLLGGLVLAAGGLAAIAMGRSQVATLEPVMLTLGAALAWAVGNLCLRVARPAHPMRFILWSSVVPLPPLLGLSLAIEGWEADWRSITGALTPSGWPGLVALLIVAVLGTVVGMSIWTGLLARNTASVVAPYSMLVPVSGMAIAMLVLGELPGWAEAFGGLAILAGVAMSSSTRRVDAPRPLDPSIASRVLERRRRGDIAAAARGSRDSRITRLDES